MPGENKLRENVNNKREGVKKSSNLIVGIITGSIIQNTWVRKQLPFILFLFLLAVLNIANITSIERKQRKKINLESELSALRAEHSYYSGEVAKRIKPSIIREKLKKYGICDAVEPVIKIKE